MKIIISPAKKMKMETDSFGMETRPVYLEETEKILKKMQSLSYEEAKAVWKCNDKLAELNYERIQNMNLYEGLTPAIFSYEGLQYQHMSPLVFSDEAIDYIKENLKILSGFYGVLSPFDGVTPYRLEMQALLQVEGKKDLYDFWQDRLYEKVVDEDRVIINLASKEYSKIIEKYLKPEDRMITIVFGELVDGKVKQKGTFAKMARGEMVRFMAENHVQDPEKIKDFTESGYRFSKEHSNEKTWVFLM